ncbi:uncharacterized protein K444DRAFT_634177 [Hyaloscypha bicolor E]|uniref:Uncharacterized protein n=1 Tax=Hyaloscypha bicolor E TaxID=1095630 RepID=A0A2J6SXE9_9HELO|nr:uncharacterized protein K444DRAFT_634177 [Hyaloscypha bicolor E]PMD55343.1 hypothetical protein K444DRAFT_634177 [Hyaloscypha bicolor E]
MSTHRKRDNCHDSMPESSQAERKKVACALRFNGNEALEGHINDRISNIPRGKPPVITEACLRLYACGPSNHTRYEYVIKIKTDPDQRKLGQGRISELIEEMDFARHIADNKGNYEIVSPELTLFTGIFDASDTSSDDEEESSCDDEEESSCGDEEESSCGDEEEASCGDEEESSCGDEEEASCDDEEDSSSYNGSPSSDNGDSSGDEENHDLHTE